MPTVNVSFSVVLPTTNVDGSTLDPAAITGISIYQGVDGVLFPNLVTTMAPSAFPVTLPVDTNNGLKFTATFTANGLTSQNSPVSTYTPPVAPSAGGLIVS